MASDLLPNLAGGQSEKLPGDWKGLPPSLSSTVLALCHQVTSQNDIIKGLLDRNGADGGDDANRLEGLERRVGNLEAKIDGLSGAEAMHCRSVKDRVRSIEARILKDVDGNSPEAEGVTSPGNKDPPQSNYLAERSARLSFEVLSTMASATQSISENVSSDFQFMVKSLNHLQDDFDLLLDCLFGGGRGGAGVGGEILASALPVDRTSRETRLNDRADRLRAQMLKGDRSESIAGFVQTASSLKERMDDMQAKIAAQQGRVEGLEARGASLPAPNTDVSRRVDAHDVEINALKEKHPMLFRKTCQRVDDLASALHMLNEGISSKLSDLPTKAVVQDMISQAMVARRAASSQSEGTRPSASDATKQASHADKRKLRQMQQELRTLSERVRSHSESHDASAKRLSRVEVDVRNIRGVENASKLAAKQTMKHLALRLDDIDDQITTQRLVAQAGTKASHEGGNGRLTKAVVSEQMRLFSEQLRSLSKSNREAHGKIKDLEGSQEDVLSQITRREAALQQRAKKDIKQHIMAEMKTWREYIERRWGQIAVSIEGAIKERANGVARTDQPPPPRAIPSRNGRDAVASARPFRGIPRALQEHRPPRERERGRDGRGGRGRRGGRARDPTTRKQA